MTMKVLLDAVVTAQPDRCSTTVQFYNIVHHTLEVEGRTDIFFYWMVPDWAIDEGKGYYPEHPNIKYIPVPQHHDRTLESLRISDEVFRNIVFYGHLWDADIIITTRSGAGALIKMLSISPREPKLADILRNVWLVEEMPLFKFKSTVLQFANYTNVPTVINSYMAVDKVWIISQHEKQLALREGKAYVTPTQIRALSQKIENTIPAKVEEVGLKREKDFPHVDGNRFCIAFAGRMAKSNNLEKTRDVMLKQFVTKGTKVELLVSTQSRVNKTFSDKELFEVRNAGREEFHDLAKTRMHVIINQPNEGGYSLSVMEPLFMGTPVIVPRAKWAEGILGPDYPFYASAEADIYGWLNLLWSDYAGQYKRFTEWWENWLIPHYSKLFDEQLLHTKTLRCIDEYGETRMSRFKDRCSTSGLELLEMMADELGDEGNLFEAMTRLGEKKLINDLRGKELESRFEKSDMIYQANWMKFRLGLKALYNYEDASVEPGHLRLAE